MESTSPALKSPSPGYGQTFATVQGAQEMEIAFARPARATQPSRQELRHGTIAPWRAIGPGVSALIGHRGSVAVLRRALAVARRTHGWLPEPPVDCGFDACVESLGDALGDRCAGEVGEGGLAVQVAFRGLLASLVGAALTEQLLGAVGTVRPAQGDSMP